MSDELKPYDPMDLGLDDTTIVDTPPGTEGDNVLKVSDPMDLGLDDATIVETPSESEDVAGPEYDSFADEEVNGLGPIVVETPPVVSETQGSAAPVAPITGLGFKP